VTFSVRSVDFRYFAPFTNQGDPNATWV